MDWKGKDRRTLQIMSAILAAQALVNRNGKDVDTVIASSVACAVLLMNSAEKMIANEGGIDGYQEGCTSNRAEVR